MLALQTSGGVLKYAAPHLRSDRDVVLAACTSDGRMLEHVDPVFLEDKEVTARGGRRRFLLRQLAIGTRGLHVGCDWSLRLRIFSVFV